MIALIQSYFSNGDLDGIWYEYLVKYYYYGALYSMIENNVEDTLSFLKGLAKISKEWHCQSTKTETNKKHTSPLVKILDDYSVYPRYGQNTEIIILNKLENPVFNKLRDLEEFKMIVKTLQDLEREAV